MFGDSDSHVWQFDRHVWRFQQPCLAILTAMFGNFDTRWNGHAHSDSHVRQFWQPCSKDGSGHEIIKKRTVLGSEFARMMIQVWVAIFRYRNIPEYDRIYQKWWKSNICSYIFQLHQGSNFWNSKQLLKFAQKNHIMKKYQKMKMAAKWSNTDRIASFSSHHGVILGLIFRSSWGHSCVIMARFWGQHSVIFGSSRHHFRVNMGPFLNHHDVIFGSSRGHFRVIIGSFGDHFGIILGSFWVHFGIILMSFWGSFWDHFGVFSGSCQ